jgi:hypothetical protein
MKPLSKIETVAFWAGTNSPLMQATPFNACTCIVIEHLPQANLATTTAGPHPDYSGVHSHSHSQLLAANLQNLVSRELMWCYAEILRSSG